MSNPFELRFKILEMAQGYLQDVIAKVKADNPKP